MKVRKDRADDAAAPSRQEDEGQQEKEVRHGRQRQEGQGQGSETEDKPTGTKVKREASEATEKNPLIESMVRCPLQPYGQHGRVP